MTKFTSYHGALETRRKLWPGLLLSAFFSMGISPSSTLADEGVAFPMFNSEAYYTALVSKMLNEDEKRVEHDKCLVDEAQLKNASEPLWHILPAKTQRMIMTKHFQNVTSQTYRTIYKYATDPVWANKDKTGQ